MTWALAAMAAPTAFSATPKTYCAPIASLTKQLSSCTDNEVIMAEAAVKCFKKFDSAANTQTVEIKKFVAAGMAADTGKNQESLLKGSEANYAEAKRRLVALIADGKKAVQEVDEYSNNLAMPEDFENATTMGFTVESFLASIPCFNDNKKVIQQIGRNFFQKINELEETRLAAEDLENRAGVRKVGVGGTDTLNGGKVSDTKGKSAAPVAGKPAKNGASDITGTDKKNKK